MAEETVLQIADSLWTSSVMGDTDDPFCNDFEEDVNVGFFHIFDAGLE